MLFEHKLRSATALIALIGIALPILARDARAEHPFAHLTGTWTGSGQARFEQGKSETITCRAYYNAKSAGAGMALAIRCASISYKIEMRANLMSEADRVTGRWEERSFNAEGGVGGRATERTLSLAISGAVSGSMSVTIDPSGHRVDITTPGTGLANVSIKFNRA
jgi:hypothetical protein